MATIGADACGAICPVKPRLSSSSSSLVEDQQRTRLVITTRPPPASSFTPRALLYPKPSIQGPVLWTLDSSGLDVLLSGPPFHPHHGHGGMANINGPQERGKKTRMSSTAESGPRRPLPVVSPRSCVWCCASPLRPAGHSPLVPGKNGGRG